MKKLFMLICLLGLFTIHENRIYGQGNGPNILLEFCTGTWCSWCPCGDISSENILNSKPNTVILAYHGGGGGDPFLNFNGNSILGYLGFHTFPTGVVSRISGVIDYNLWESWCDTVQNKYQPSITYSIDKNYNFSTRQLQVTANVTALRNIDTNCSISLVITEDGVVYAQSGNSNCPGGSNYIHKWIVRNMVNGALGEQLSNSSWGQGTTKTKSWTTNMNSSWVDVNYNFAIFVYLTGNSLTTRDFVLQTFKNGVTVPIGIKQNQKEIPASYFLSQNYPNPFNPTTNIKFSIPRDENVSLKIYDVTGALVQVYLDGFVTAGTYNAEVDATELSSGIYFYKLIAGDFILTKKMIVLK